MDKELLKSSTGKILHKELSKFYKDISDEYLNELKSFVKNPKSLKAYLMKDIDENDLLPELQKIVRVSKDGKGRIELVS